MPEITFRITNSQTQGHFTARIIEEGQRFGRGMCLTHEGSTLIEFYAADQGRVEDTEGNVLGCSIGKPRLLSALLDEIHTAPAGHWIALHPAVRRWYLDHSALMELKSKVAALDLIEEWTPPDMEMLAAQKGKAPSAAVTQPGRELS